MTFGVENEHRHIAIDSFDLYFATERFRDENKLDAGQTAVVEREFRRFMHLVLEVDGPLAVVDKRVDDLWHTFILFTPQYNRFCDDIMGFFVHHQPNTPQTPVAECAIANFVSEYQKRFDQLEAFWLELFEPEARASLISGTLPTNNTFQWSGWPGRRDTGVGPWV